jgi:hypothetical protein
VAARPPPPGRRGGPRPAAGPICRERVRWAGRWRRTKGLTQARGRHRARWGRRARGRARVWRRSAARDGRPCKAAPPPRDRTRPLGLQVVVVLEPLRAHHGRGIEPAQLGARLQAPQHPCVPPRGLRASYLRPAGREGQAVAGAIQRAARRGARCPSSELSGGSHARLGRGRVGPALHAPWGSYCCCLMLPSASTTHQGAPWFARTSRAFRASSTPV